MAPTNNSLKFGKICRICLKQLDDMYHLFEKGVDEEADQEVDIVEKITILAHVEVSARTRSNFVCQSALSEIFYHAVAFEWCDLSKFAKM